MSGLPTRGEVAAVGTGGVVVLGAAMLLTRVLRPTLEIRRYVKDTATAAERLEENFSSVAQFERTREATRELLRLAADGAA